MARLLSHRGERLSASVWAVRADLDNTVLRRRLDAGWSVAEAIDTPPQPDEDTALVRAKAAIPVRLRYSTLDAAEQSAATARWSALLGVSLPA